MTYVPRIENNILKIFDSITGSIKTTITLPNSCTFGQPLLSNQYVIITLTYNTTGEQKARTYELKTGKFVKEINL